MNREEDLYEALLTSSLSLYERYLYMSKYINKEGKFDSENEVDIDEYNKKLKSIMLSKKYLVVFSYYMNNRDYYNAIQSYIKSVIWYSMINWH